MKTLKRLFILAIFSGLIFLNTTCNKKAFTEITIQGYVYDTIGGKPVKGEWVSLDACVTGDSRDQCNYFRVGQSVSDAKGHFYIHNEAATSNRYSIYVNGNFNYGGFSSTADEISKVDTIYLKY
jgi:hypothetical protein